MAGLGALLGGYGSDEEDDALSSEGEAADPNATGAVRILQDASPAASQQSGDEAAQLDGQAPHVLAGPAANPEPPPEGLSPPVHHSDDEGGGTAAEMRSAAYILPPELREAPQGDPHPDLVAKVTRFLDIKETTGRTVMDAMRGMREWNNPDFLEKMVEHFSLDQYGSCFPRAVWDPTSLPPEDTWAELSAALRQAEERRREERARRAAVPFASGGLQLPLGAGGTAGLYVSGAPLQHPHQPQQAPKGPGLARAPLNTAAAGGALGAHRAAALAQAAAKAQAVAAAMQQGAGSKWDAPKR